MGFLKLGRRMPTIRVEVRVRVRVRVTVRRKEGSFLHKTYD